MDEDRLRSAIPDHEVAVLYDPGNAKRNTVWIP